MTEHERASIDRGVTPTTAAELAHAYPEERIQERLEAFDWLVAKNDRRILEEPGRLPGRIHPQGIRLAPRLRVEAQCAQRLAAQEEQRRKVEEVKRQVEADQRAQEEAEQARIKAYWDALSPAQQERLREEALRRPGLASFVKQYERCRDDPELATRYLKKILEAHILDQLQQTGKG